MKEQVATYAHCSRSLVDKIEKICITDIGKLVDFVVKRDFLPDYVGES